MGTDIYIYVYIYIYIYIYVYIYALYIISNRLPAMLREVLCIFSLCVEDLCEAVLLKIVRPTGQEKSKVLSTNSLDPPKYPEPRIGNPGLKGRNKRNEPN